MASVPSGTLYFFTSRRQGKQTRRPSSFEKSTPSFVYRAGFPSATRTFSSFAQPAKGLSPTAAREAGSFTDFSSHSAKAQSPSAVRPAGSETALRSQPEKAKAPMEARLSGRRTLFRQTQS